MAAGADGEETFEEGYGKTSELAVQAVYKGTGGKGGWNGGKGPSWSVQKYFTSPAAKAKKARIVLERDSGPRREARKEEKGQEKGGNGHIRVCCSCGEPGHIAASCVKGSWNRSLNAVEEDKGDISQEVREGGDGLCAWCSLEKSENEQWQEVASKKSKLKSKEVAHESLLSVENKSCASPKKVIEVKDNWVNIRATVDTGAAGHVMLAEMFRRVKLDRTTATKKLVAAHGETLKTWVRKPYHSSPLKECTEAKKSGARAL